MVNARYVSLEKRQSEGIRVWTRYYTCTRAYLKSIGTKIRVSFNYLEHISLLARNQIVDTLLSKSGFDLLSNCLVLKAFYPFSDLSAKYQVLTKSLNWGFTISRQKLKCHFHLFLSWQLTIKEISRTKKLTIKIVIPFFMHCCSWGKSV